MQSLGINHTTVKKSVKRLEEAGLVVRKRSDLDKRVTIVSLTKEAIDLKDEVVVTPYIYKIDCEKIHLN